MDRLLSERVVLDAIENNFVGNSYDIAEVIKKLPSAEPQERTGKWIPFDIPWYRCSECGATREQIVFMENFCPNCGARMEGKHE